MKTNHDLFAAFLDLFVSACGHRGSMAEALIEMGKIHFTPRGDPFPIDEATYEQAMRDFERDLPTLLDELDRAPGGFQDN